MVVQNAAMDMLQTHTHTLHVTSGIEVRVRLVRCEQEEGIYMHMRYSSYGPRGGIGHGRTDNTTGE